MAKEKSMRLFDEMSRDASGLLLNMQDAVLCPLCLEKIDRVDAYSKLTLEHVIPESVGGKEVTLSCCRCNNDRGSDLDSHLARQLQQDHAFRSGESRKGWIKVASAKAGTTADFSVGRDGALHVDALKCTPVVAERLKSFFTERSATGNLTINLDFKVIDRNATASIVKAAYLGLFVEWGYRYILSPSLDRVRRAIQVDGEDRNRLREVVLPLSAVQQPSFDGLTFRITLEVRFSNGTEAAVSILNLSKFERAYLVLLPPRTDFAAGGWDGLSRAASLLRQNRLELNMNL